MPESKPDRPFPLLDYLDKRVEELRKLTPAALRGDDVDSVHYARVATRRLKAACDLLDPILSTRCKKPFERVGKTLRKQLGPLRDLDVMLEHLAAVKSPQYAAAVHWLRDRLQNRRRELVQAAKDDIPPSRVLAKLGTWWGVRQDIVEGEDQITELLKHSVHLRLDAFAEQAEQLIQIQQPVAERQEKNDPHQLRIAGKSLRYTLEMAREHGAPLPAALFRQFKQMQDYLGLWHDYIVLTETVLRETVDCDLALHDPALQELILKLAQATLRKAQSELRKMSDSWKRRGEEVCRQLRAQFPLSKPPEAVVVKPVEDALPAMVGDAPVEADITPA